MKQLANQTVARAEKTEVLCEDLLQFKLCMDMVQSIYHHSHKSLMVCFQGQCGTDARRYRKPLSKLKIFKTHQLS